MELSYMFNYDRDTKDFKGYVLSPLGFIVYEIESADYMKEMIEYGIMNDIDDIEGLEGYLRQESVISKKDFLVLTESA